MMNRSGGRLAGNLILREFVPSKKSGHRGTFRSDEMGTVRRVRR
jgi:hypothetical protein